MEGEKEGVKMKKSKEVKKEGRKDDGRRVGRSEDERRKEVTKKRRKDDGRRIERSEDCVVYQRNMFTSITFFYFGNL